jgi:predicted nucleic acid-binding protein
MRLLLDTNILLDVILSDRAGKHGSTLVLDLCESGSHHGMVAWQTLPTVSYYHRKGHTNQETWDMLRDLLAFIDVPTVRKRDLLKAWNYSLTDFEDALQVACAEADQADYIITRNLRDFAFSPIPALTPEAFLAQFVETDP